jgi:hypothetical protein
MGTRLLKLFGVVFGAAALIAPASSWGSATIGANLAALTPNIAGYNCGAGHPCTVANTELLPSFTAANGLSSPVKGTVTSFQVRTGPVTGPLQLRVLRPAGIFHTGAGTAAPVSPPMNQISPSYPVSLPIRPGDVIGLNCCQSGANAVQTAALPSGNNYAAWGINTSPALGDGETREPDSGSHTAALIVSAEVEPDNSFTLGQVKAKLGRIKLQATVPNPGVLSAGTRLLKSSRFTVNTAGTVGLVGKPTRTGRARLSKTGKLKIVVTYTPTFGAAATQKIKAKVKPKR